MEVNLYLREEHALIQENREEVSELTRPVAELSHRMKETLYVKHRTELHSRIHMTSEKVFNRRELISALMCSGFIIRYLACVCD